MSVLNLPRHIYIESGIINKLGEFVKAHKGNRVFIIMDSFLASSPIDLDKRVEGILAKENLNISFFSDYAGEPTTDHVKAAVERLNSFNGDCVIAIGGGSAIDIAKAVSLFGKDPEIKWDEIRSRPCLNRFPLLAVPTTAGTGSEATSIMVITETETSFKMNPSHPDLIPDAAILDPELTVSLPSHFTAYTGMDALTHAMEAYVSNRATPMTDFFALEAIRIVGRALPKVYQNGSDVESRKDMILGSCYAGIAFTNASTNLVHAAGRPLGARFHIPHGLSIALLLPFVMKFGLESAKERYADVSIALGEDPSLNKDELAKRSIEIIEEFNNQFRIWEDGKKFINPEQLMEAIPTLVTDALSGNGILTNRKVPKDHDIAVIFNLLAERLSVSSLNHSLQ
ncbi:iron-containing alcohol dehydrogenase [Neobacillus mesonae]|uniref:iron-containing alcohol dehydrogenase n=1 Tax=Neobacillus mesonae TaxID=1193713 RepID=UPI00203A9108|nr:iron-containing alcohol dehydrogenase [Neobacillus mesonae]MCM3570426.1 iron-containing alcohol dehydrogenase [Neobacillus mesonae]